MYVCSGDTMLQVQVFDEEHEDDLTDSMNAFLWTHPNLQIHDIKFSTAVSALSEEIQIFCFSAMIIYRDREEEEEAY